jgi:hypothetical protein
MRTGLVKELGQKKMKLGLSKKKVTTNLFFSPPSPPSRVAATIDVTNVAANSLKKKLIHWRGIVFRSCLFLFFTAYAYARIRA